MIFYYLFINILAFFIFFIDKCKAKHNANRISENKLISIILLGGSLGSLLSMFIFKHKTKKAKFYFFNILSLIIHLLIINLFQDNTVFTIAFSFI